MTLGIVPPNVLNTSTCWVVVNTQAKSKTILPNTLNGMSILTNCATTGTRDPRINTASLNTLLAQTLALSFNILYPLATRMRARRSVVWDALLTGISALSPLTNASTVEAVRDQANYLIGNAKLGAPVVTQTQIGAMNTLLGCMNAEA